MDSNFVLAHRYLGMVYEQKGMYRDAIAELEKAFELSKGMSDMPAPLGHVYALSGNRQKARQGLAELQEMSKRRYFSAFDTAVIYAGLRDKEQALEWLRRAFEERSWGLTFLKVDPRFDWLRSDPQFANLLRRMGLTP